MEELIIFLYVFSLSVLFIFGCYSFFMVFHLVKYYRTVPDLADCVDAHPPVTIQLPIYNEYYVVERLLDAACGIEYPRELLEIQVLDDSTDETVALVAEKVARLRNEGFDIRHIRRQTREGFKAGALKEGLLSARGEFIAIFDADFVPKKDFLTRTIPHFLNDPGIGMVQTRWEHINSDYSLLTRTQAMALDGHFVVEQAVRNHAGLYMNFNGTAGIWRKQCIEESGNWQSDTLTEDLDLSYRAQLKGWRFIYLRDVTSPAELPSEINALKSQQFRWTKGAIETARKILPRVWGAAIPLRTKIHATFHLTNNLVFPFIVLAGILNVPLVFIKHQGNHDVYFVFMSIFVFAFVGSFLFYLYSQKSAYPDWRKRVLLFPVFMAGTMGFAVNNTRAVLEGLLRRKSEFVRTPKYSIRDKGDTWVGKQYVPTRFDTGVILEVALTVYCLFGVASSLYFLEIAAVPFQLLFFLGFGFVSFMSLKHIWIARHIGQGPVVRP
ncbi:MAG: glycosyltransferase family 2 protein [Ignavibacteria bacterium]|nr:glycosyltransferase family 2 protein [Ignavibacteria bacterium]